MIRAVSGLTGCSTPFWYDISPSDFSDPPDERRLDPLNILGTFHGRAGIELHLDANTMDPSILRVTIYYMHLWMAL